MNIVPLFIIIPLTAAFVIPLLGKLSKKSSDVLANLSVFSMVVVSVVLFFELYSRGFVTYVYKVGGAAVHRRKRLFARHTGRNKRTP